MTNDQISSLESVRVTNVIKTANKFPTYWADQSWSELDWAQMSWTTQIEKCYLEQPMCTKP